MILKPRTMLGPYEIVAPIEAGGMGSVFRARDTRLGRAVAIKVLPAESTGDERLVKRFTLEARAAAAVTHPNVVAVYDVGQEMLTFSTPFGPDTLEVRFLVEELVEGVSLRKLLRAGRPPIPKLLEIVLGIARGLVAAHEKGLIHRDLKPENILIDASGNAKIADFGLVRWIYPETAAPSSDGPPIPAVTSALTKTGFVVGTLGYMSPEQARGDPLAPASDLFVFGILLYELLTGIAPFARPSAEEAFNAVLKEGAPPLAKTSTRVPIPLARIVERCLEKDVGRRYKSAAQVQRDLEQVQRELTKSVDAPRGFAPVPPPPQAPGRSGPTPLFLIVATTIAALALAAGYMGGMAHVKSAPTPVVAEIRAEVLGSPWPSGSEPLDASLSPDGGQIAITLETEAGPDVFVMPARRGAEARRISSEAAGGRAPWFTRDGSHILFSTSRPAQTPAVWDVDLVHGGEPRRLAEDAEDPSLSADEALVAFVRRAGESTEIWIARREGDGAQRILAPGAGEWRFPVFAPDGKSLIVYDVHPGSLSPSATLTEVNLADPRPKPLVTARVDPGGRPLCAPGTCLVRSRGDRSAFLVSSKGSHREPFGADLSLLAATPAGRTVLTRAVGGALVLWTR